MDSLINAAARALAAGDPLAALGRVALREDPPALALRGIALAQLGDLARARGLLRRAARAFGPREAVARARCMVAEAEVALAARDLTASAAPLAAAEAVLARHGDAANAAQARSVALRRLLLLGRLTELAAGLAREPAEALPPALAAAHGLLEAGLAIRRREAGRAADALARAAAAAGRAGIPALAAEVEAARSALRTPAARLLGEGRERLLTLAEVEAHLAAPGLLIDACRYEVRGGPAVIALGSRPVLFGLARVLAEAGPEGAGRAQLLAQVFGARSADESHRARLRVEIGRLRRLLAPVAGIEATAGGFRLISTVGRVTVLAPPTEAGDAELLALLADGEAWSSSALALALGRSQRSVQRVLGELAGTGRLTAAGRGRGRRWLLPPVPAFTTALLLPASLPPDGT